MQSTANTSSMVRPLQRREMFTCLPRLPVTVVSASPNPPLVCNGLHSRDGTRSACLPLPCMTVRHEYLLHLGISADDVARRGDALALSELNLKYLRPLRSGDRFLGTCRLVKATAARLVFEQQLWRLPPRRHGAEGQQQAHTLAANGGDSSSSSSSLSSSSPAAALQQQRGELVLSAEAVVVSLDSSYRPKRINPLLREAMATGRPVAAADGQPVHMQELM